MVREPEHRTGTQSPAFSNLIQKEVNKNRGKDGDLIPITLHLGNTWSQRESSDRTIPGVEVKTFSISTSDGSRRKQPCLEVKDGLAGTQDGDLCTSVPVFFKHVLSNLSSHGGLPCLSFFGFYQESRLVWERKTHSEKWGNTIVSSTQGRRPQSKAPFTVSIHKQQVTQTRNAWRDPWAWIKTLQTDRLIFALGWWLAVFAVEAAAHFQVWFRKTVNWLFHLHPEGKAAAKPARLWKVSFKPKYEYIFSCCLT